MALFHILPSIIALLQREGRVSYRALKVEFALDDAHLEALRDELIYAKRLAQDEGGRVLIWRGGAQPAVDHIVTTTPESVMVTADTTPIPEMSTLPPLVTTGAPASPPPLDESPTESLDADALTPSPSVHATAPEPTRRFPEAERRQVTVMFCDLVDSTKLAQQLDPEDYRAVVRAYQTEAAEAIKPFDGHIAQYLGDGLMVYFGWPQAYEDAAARAVYAGLAIVGAIGPLNDRQIEPQYGVRVAVRIGLHTGMAVIGEMGGGDRHEQLAMGDTPNIASRLQGLAAPNTVVLSALTARLLQGVFALENLGSHSLKGVVEPMQVFRVLDRMEVDGDENILSNGPVLVGRDEEIGLLLRRWEQSKEGLGQVVLVSGEAGIGKSSLVDRIRTRVRSENLTRVALRCSPYHTNSALYPLLTHIQHVLRFERDDDAQAKLAKMEHILQSVRFPLHEVVPLLAALLTVPLPEGRYPPLHLTPLQQRQQTHDLLVAWMLEEAERQPVLMVWEDLHWADPSTLELLGLFIDQAPTVSLLHLLTFRPEFVPPWLTRSHMTPLTPNRLERPQVETMIARLAGGKALPAEVVEHIVSKTDGVPLFIEELTKMLLESDLLYEAGDAYALTGPLAAVTIPATLYDSLMARLDRLPTVREVAQLGAVLGRGFSYEVLEALIDMEASTLQHGLSQLVDAELLYQRGRPPRSRYLFKHALIQDAAYASLLKSTRQHYHQRIAQLFETRFPETVTAEPELVAHHYTEAGHAEPAVGYWQQAGARAIQRSANVEAIAHLQKGIELLTRLPDTPERAQHELALLTTLGPALLVTKGYAAPEVVQAYTRARQLCQQMGESPEHYTVLWNLWLFYLARSEHQTALKLGQQCLNLAQRVQDEALILEAHLAIGICWFYLGKPALACTHLEQTIALYDREQHHTLAFRYGGIDPGVTGFGYHAWALWMRGYPEQARTQSDRALTLAENFAHPFTLVRALYYDTVLCQLSRDTQAVQEQADATFTVATEHGVAMVLALCPIMRGWAKAMQEQSTEGIVQMRQGIETYRGTGAEFQRPHFLTMLAEASGMLGQPKGGMAALDEALTLIEKMGECYYEAELHRLRGELLLMQADENQAVHDRRLQEDAATCFHKALDVARQQEAKSWELRAAMSLAKLWQSQNKHREALDLLAPVYNWFTEGFDTADLIDAKTLLDALSRSRSQST